MSSINLNLFGMNFNGLAGFSQTIHDGFVAEVADYPTPAPGMPAFQTDIDDLNTAIAKWGVKGNHGSHVDHLVLLAARTVVRTDLRLLSTYAMNEQPDNPLSWRRVGFKTKDPKTPPQPLQAVQNFRHFIDRNVPATSVKLRWKRPLGARRGDVKGYIIQRNNVDEIPLDAKGTRGVTNIIGYVPNTAFIDNDPFVGENFYWVTPYNSIGLGVTSPSVMVVSGKSK